MNITAPVPLARYRRPARPPVTGLDVSPTPAYPELDARERSAKQVGWRRGVEAERARWRAWAAAALPQWRFDYDTWLPTPPPAAPTVASGPPAALELNAAAAVEVRTATADARGRLSLRLPPGATFTITTATGGAAVLTPVPTPTTR